MKHSIALTVAAALLSIASVAGCQKETDTEPRAPTMTTGAAGAMGVLSNDEGMLRMVEARCDRAVACEEVGAGKRYPTKERCKEEVRPSLAAAIGQTACPRGLREDRVDACVSEVRGTNCTVPGESIGQLAVCRESALCVPR